VVHPLAGQGINLGFLDAGVLAEEILRAQQRGVALGDATVLARYQRRRRAHNALMLNALNGIKTFFGQRDPALVFLRNTGMRLVNRLAPVKSLLAAEALGRHGDLPALARAPRR
jgi:2-octaprenylphenol hydroxylase